MQVELDIFSGRKNPTWVLTTYQASVARQLIKKLSDDPNTSPTIFNGLGYRGFLLNDETDECVIFIWRESVVLCQGEARLAKMDKQRQLEQMLLQTAQSHLEPELFNWIQSQIDEVDQ